MALEPNTSDVPSLFRESLRQHDESMKDSIVFADEVGARILTSVLPSSVLYSDLRVRMVLPLSPEPIDKTVKPAVDAFGVFSSAGRTGVSKGVFIVSGQVDQACDNIVATAKKFLLQSLVVLAVISEGAHLSIRAEEQPLSDGIFAALSKKMTEELEALQCRAVVKELGLPAMPLLHDTFVMPPCSTDFPLLPRDFGSGPDAQEALSGLSSIEGAPRKLQASLKSLAHCLSDALSALDLGSAEVYSLGSTARAIGDELVGLMLERPGSLEGSVIVMDRTLDLATPLSHSDSLADRMFSLQDGDMVIPSQATEDLRVGLPGLGPTRHPLVSSTTEPLAPWTSVAPGLHPDGRDGLDTLVNTKRTKEALMALRKNLVACLSKEKVPLDLTRMGVVSAAQLQGFVDGMAAKPAAAFKHLGVLGLAQAAIRAMAEGGAGRWDEMAGIEKIMQLGVEGSSVAEQVCELLAPSAASWRGQVRDILGLVMYTYSMTGEPMREEDRLTVVKAMAEALVDTPQEMPLPGISEAFADLNESSGASNDEVNLRKRMVSTQLLEDLFDIMESIAHGGRAGLTGNYTSLLRPNEESGGPFCPVLQTLCKDIAGKTGAELSVLYHVNPSLGSFVRSGFSAFGLGSGRKDRPADKDVIVIFVIGGITCTEIREIRECLAPLGDKKIIIGSTGVATSNSIFRTLFTR